jgi:hypothetical protein
LTSGRRPVVKIIAESLSEHAEKHVAPTALRVGKEEEEEEVNYTNTEMISLYITLMCSCTDYCIMYLSKPFSANVVI